MNPFLKIIHRIFFLLITIELDQFSDELKKTVQQTVKAGTVGYPDRYTRCLWGNAQLAEDFAYRTGMQWWIFVLPAFITVAIALCTVAFKATKATLANPTKSLRNEE